jgi:transposase
MALRPDPISPVPEETARVAHAAFPKGHPYLRLRDTLGTIYEDEQFAGLFPSQGRPAEAPWRLALVTVLQFAEGLSDRQAADAVRDRLAWKYLLGLELTDAGFHFSILSDFRARLVEGGAEHLLLDALLERCTAVGLVRPRGKQRTDSTHVLAAVRALNRLECVGETLRATLNVLAAVAPDWLRAQVPATWHERYDRRVESPRGRLSAAAFAARAGTIGADGRHLLCTLYGPTAPPWLRALPAVHTLRQVWLQYFYAPDAVTGVMRLRTREDMPPAAQQLQSPYDPDARYASKYDTAWLGYRVHLTETCDADTPHLITQVATVLATTNDSEMTTPIQEDLAARAYLPGQHLLDAGYVTAQHLLHSAETHGIAVIGPVLLDTSWQAATPEGFDHSAFTIDWEERSVTCPQGHRSRSWHEVSLQRSTFRYPCVTVKFDKATCRACAVRPRCTRSTTKPRQLTLRPRAEHEALRQARQRQTEPAFTALYAQRAGIEGTLAQGVYGYDARRARYRTLARVHLEHVALAVAISLQRLDDWWTQTPRAPTRVSRFAALAA